jgi:hypothetical protein
MKNAAAEKKGGPQSVKMRSIADCESAARRISRRGFLGNMLLLSAAMVLTRATDLLTSRGWAQAAEIATPDLIHDTFNGLLAFIVPGPDDYSVAQGVSTVEPGGVDEGVTDILIATLDETTPFLPQFSATVAGILNGIGPARSSIARWDIPFAVRLPFVRGEGCGLPNHGWHRRAQAISRCAACVCRFLLLLGGGRV